MEGGCEHKAFKVFGEVQTRAGFGMEARLFAQCVACGTPVRFMEKSLTVEGCGLVAVVVCELAGD